MMVIHKTWCGACKGETGCHSNQHVYQTGLFCVMPTSTSPCNQMIKGELHIYSSCTNFNRNKGLSLTLPFLFILALKPKFAASKEIADLSKKFVMVNIQVSRINAM
jgi:hypothetical protein